MYDLTWFWDYICLWKSVMCLGFDFPIYVNCQNINPTINELEDESANMFWRRDMLQGDIGDAVKADVLCDMDGSDMVETCDEFYFGK